MQGTLPLAADVGLLILRLATGLVFIPHGWLKLNPQGPLKGPTGFAAWLKQMGVPAPRLLAWVVALLETAGAVLLIAGLGTRPIALGLAIDMSVAIVLVRMRVGKASFFGTQAAGWEFEFILMGAALALLFTGAGSLSLEALLGF